jgi:hypothetical protein
MIPGITANDSQSHSGGGSYQASAVSFGGTTTLVNSSLTSTDNNFVSFAGWFRPASNDFANSGVPYVVDPANNYYTFMSFFPTGPQFEFKPQGIRADTGPGSDTVQYFSGGGNPTLTAGTWYHIIGSLDGTGPDPHVAKIYLNDIDSNASITPSTLDEALTPLANGLPFWVGGDGEGDPYYGSLADFSFWPGVSFLVAGDIPLATRRLFLDASGAPVNPSTAIATLGQPPVMLSGDA